MFDSSAQFATSIRRADGLKKIVVRWPTDEEWAERQRGIQIHITRQGRGISETSADSTKADAAMYAKIRTPDSPELAAEEAQKIIDVLATCMITDVALDGDVATVEMTILNDEKVSHQLRMPTTAQVAQFKRASVRVLDLPHGRQRLRMDMQPGLDLYDRCSVETTGYVNGAPAIHREAAVRAVIDACDAQVESPDGMDF